jgi:RNA polymerase-interacting CarD/CdnL/TRCF family regulator
MIHSRVIVEEHVATAVHVEHDGERRGALSRQRREQADGCVLRQGNILALAALLICTLR